MTPQERREGIAQLRRILDAMIYMLQDNPELPLPWVVDLSIDTDPETFAALAEKHGLKIYAFGGQAALEPLMMSLIAASDREALYLPWSLTASDDPGKMGEA